MLFNPGGPGGSGTYVMELMGKDLTRVLGSYDVLGFDPRGINASTPRADCFTSESQAKIWEIQEGNRILNASDETLGLYRAREEVVARRCEAAIGGENGIAQFMGTASVARDMLEISKKLGQEKLLYWGVVSIIIDLSVEITTHKAGTPYGRVMDLFWANTSPRCIRTKSDVSSLTVSTTPTTTAQPSGILISSTPNK